MSVDEEMEIGQNTGTAVGKVFLKQGQEYTFELLGYTVEDKIVTRFSSKLPERGIVWRKYDNLNPTDQKLVDSLEPDKINDKMQKSKFAKRYNLHLREVSTGRNFFKEFNGKYGPWERCDVVFYVSDKRPWKDFSELLQKLGAKPGEKFKISNILKIGTKFNAKLKLGTDGFLHIDQRSLVPAYEVANETPEKKHTNEMSDVAKKLLEFLINNPGILILDAAQKPGWEEVKNNVKSYTDDNVHVKIVPKI